MRAGPILACALAMVAPTGSSRLDAADPNSPPPPPVLDRSWEIIDGDNEGLTFLDRVGSRHSRQVVRARLFSIYSPVDPGGASGALTLVEIDCRTGAGAVVERRRYKANARQIDGGIVPPAERLSQVPAIGTREARVAARLCGHSGAAGSDETVLIRFRASYGICLGLCPDFETRVGPGGWVVSHNLHRRDVHRFRVSPSHLGSFRAILESLRPRGEIRLDAECEHVRLADGTLDPLHDPRPDDLEVRWIGAHVSARLTACDYTHLATRRTIENAMRVLGVDPYSGGRYKDID
jgi:hypothetical protein